MRSRGRALLRSWIVVIGLAMGSPAVAGAALPSLSHLQPGARADVQQEVPVTVVMVGLEPGGGPTGIDPARLVAGLPPANKVVDRTTRAIEAFNPDLPADFESSAIGLTYDYDYRTVFAHEAFEDAFFGYLASIALGPIPGGTVFQQFYSSNPLAAQPIDESFTIDAVAAERWLAANAGPLLGVDTTRPTVFLVNWFGRSDFRFHTYGFQGVRPGFPFAIGFTQAGQMSAWGGTPAQPIEGPPGPASRVWFYDVSAGPDLHAANFLLEFPDIVGDPATDDRIAPIWEYGTTHWFRPFDDLTGDLAKLVRFVAVDALFGASPVYDPAISEPLLSDRIEIDLNLFAGQPGRDPAWMLRLADVPAIFDRLDPTRSYPVDAARYPLDGAIAKAFDCNQTAFGPAPQPCFGSKIKFTPDPGNPSVNAAYFALDAFFFSKSPQYLDGTRYEAPVAFFDLPDGRIDPTFGLAGLASLMLPNLQGWTYIWATDAGRSIAARTDTGLLSHEVGHHIGLSHVHDAFDPLLDTDVTADGATFPMNAGIQTYTTMSYIPNTDDFGQFDMDNMARWLVAARIDNANRILGDVARSPRSGRAATAASAADAAAGAALSALSAWDLKAASAHAGRAYARVLDAAAAAGVQVEPFAASADGFHGRGPIQAAIDDRRDTAVRLPPGIEPAALTARYGR